MCIGKICFNVEYRFSCRIVSITWLTPTRDVILFHLCIVIIIIIIYYVDITQYTMSFRQTYATL